RRRLPLGLADGGRPARLAAGGIRLLVLRRVLRLWADRVREGVAHQLRMHEVRGAAGGAPRGATLWRRSPPPPPPPPLPAPLAPRNSLRSLRSLRSNSRGESDHEARGYARRARCCGARRPRNRPHRVPPTALRRSWHSTNHHGGARKGVGGRPAQRICAAEKR